MSEAEQNITEAQQKAAAFLSRPRLRFEPKSPERIAAEAKAAAEEQARLEAEAIANAQVGDKMADGTIFAGISPDTNQPMYAAPADAPLGMDFNAAAKYAEGLEVGGKKGFRIPTKAELNVLFQNREKGALKGTFNLTGSDTAGWYWSSTPYNVNYAYGQRFSDGGHDFYGRNSDSSVRCVR